MPGRSDTVIAPSRMKGLYIGDIRRMRVRFCKDKIRELPQSASRNVEFVDVHAKLHRQSIFRLDPIKIEQRVKTWPRLDKRKRIQYTDTSVQQRYAAEI